MQLPIRSAIIDGEVIVPDANGASSFHELRGTIHRAPEQLVFVAFDLLHLDGRDMRPSPLEERRAALRQLIEGSNARLAFSYEIEGDGADVFAAAERMNLEGIVSKRKGAQYRAGSRAGWFKTKCFTTGTFEGIGASKTPGGAPVALLAADGHYTGSAFIALRADVRDAFSCYVEARQAQQPGVKGAPREGVTWVQPGLVVTVKHLRGEEMLRHASVVQIAAHV